MDIYVGNLPYSTTSDELRDLFSQHGTVSRATVVSDRESGRSKGFGFVDMPDDGEGRNAIAALSELDMDGRRLVVNEARPRAPRRDGPPPRGGGGGGGGDRGGDRGPRRQYRD